MNGTKSPILMRLRWRDAAALSEFEAMVPMAVGYSSR